MHILSALLCHGVYSFKIDSIMEWPENASHLVSAQAGKMQANPLQLVDSCGKILSINKRQIITAQPQFLYFCFFIHSVR